MNRETSVYQIEFPDAAPPLLQAIVEQLPLSRVTHELAGSGVDYRKIVFIRVRVRDDHRAKQLAEAVCGGLEFSIRTGYGVHQRSVL